MCRSIEPCQAISSHKLAAVPPGEPSAVDLLPTRRTIARLASGSPARWDVVFACAVPGRCPEVDPRARRATGTRCQFATCRRLGGVGPPVVHPAVDDGGWRNGDHQSQLRLLVSCCPGTFVNVCPGMTESTFPFNTPSCNEGKYFQRY